MTRAIKLPLRAPASYGAYKVFAGVRWKFIGSGHTRIVYRHPTKNLVLKVPKNEWGVHCNEIERKTYLGFWRHTPLMGRRYAKCRLVQDGMLLMELVQIKPLRGKTPDWVFWIDLKQVGYNRRGELVAYDYGG